MSELIVIGYNDQFKAEETRIKFLRMQREHLVDLEDAVVAVKQEAFGQGLRQPVMLIATTATAAKASSLFMVRISGSFLEHGE